MSGRWGLLSRAGAASPTLRVAALMVYYLVILGGLVVLYGRGDFSTPSFVYQGF